MTTYKKNSPEWRKENFEECKKDILELKGNPFVENAKAIKIICDIEGVDVGVGLDMFINEKYTQEERKDINKKLIKQYKGLCQKYYLNYIVEVQEAMKAEAETL